METGGGFPALSAQRASGSRTGGVTSPIRDGGWWISFCFRGRPRVRARVWEPWRSRRDAFDGGRAVLTARHARLKFREAPRGMLLWSPGTTGDQAASAIHRIASMGPRRRRRTPRPHLIHPSRVEASRRAGAAVFLRLAVGTCAHASRACPTAGTWALPWPEHLRAERQDDPADLDLWRATSST